MLEMQGLLNGFALALTPVNLLFGFIGAVLGTAVGVLPGLGPAATISLLLPITYALGSPLTSIIMMAGIYCGAMYGGSTTSILLNIPGEAASVVTCIDGYKMAKNGRAGAALGISAIGSFIAGTFGIIALTFIAPPLSSFALKFGPTEYFSLTLLGLTLAAFLSGKSMLKGMLMAVLGLLLATVGIDPVGGALRYTFGTMILMDGFDFLALAMGVFGIGEILISLEEDMNSELVTTKIKDIYPTMKDWLESRWAILRGTVIGFGVGLLPGGGAVMASMIAYAIEKRVSKTPERFGEGAIEGVASPESANNAASSASFIPMLTLGIPSNGVMALMIGAMLIKGIQPGPNVMSAQPALFWGVIVSMWIGNLFCLILNLPLVGLWAKLVSVPYHLLFPVIVGICCIGAFSINNKVFDVELMVFFSIIGVIFSKLDCEPAPLLLGFVVGPMFEENLRRALVVSRGDPMIFIERPISATLLAIVLVILLLPLLPAINKKRKDAFAE